MRGEKLVTESESNHRHLEQMSFRQLLDAINREDQQVPHAVSKAIPQLEKMAKAAYAKMENGGRLVYIGAGTSGRLGMVDASECQPTFGVDPGRVIGIIAGGQDAMFRPIEFAEDNLETGWQDLEKHKISTRDFVVGISASGTTPYVLSALKACSLNGIQTGCIVSNPGSPIAEAASFAVEVITGPEFLTGSTRMKSGTAQKLVLNMLSTSVMINLGLVEDNKMVNMLLANEKLFNRGVKMVLEATGITNKEEARKLLVQHGSVKKAVAEWKAHRKE